MTKPLYYLTNENLGSHEILYAIFKDETNLNTGLFIKRITRNGIITDINIAGGVLKINKRGLTFTTYMITGEKSEVFLSNGIFKKIEAL